MEKTGLGIVFAGSDNSRRVVKAVDTGAVENLEL
jgi:hypothetical protein